MQASDTLERKKLSGQSGFRFTMTRLETMAAPCRGLGEDNKAVLLYQPESGEGADWIAQAGHVLLELQQPQTRLVHVFQTIADPSYGMETQNRYIARQAEQAFHAMYDMDPVANALHLAVAPTQVTVAACKIPFNDLGKETIGKALAGSVTDIVVKHAGKKLTENLADEWTTAIRFCIPKIRSIIKVLEPMADTSKPAEVSVTCHRGDDHTGHRFEELAPCDRIHAMLTLQGGLHHAIRWEKHGLYGDTLITEYFHARDGLTVRDSAKKSIMTAARPYAHTVVLNVDVAKKPSLPAPAGL